MDADDYLEYEDSDSLDDSDEGYDDSLDDSDESTRRRKRRSIRTAQGGEYTIPRMGQGGVTQVQFQTSLNRIGNDIRRNSAAIRSVNRRVDATSARQSKAVSKVRGDLKQTRDMSMLMPLLIRPKTVSIPDDVLAKDGQTIAIPKDTKVQVESSDNLSLMLPLLLMGGMGGGDSGGGSNNMMMMLLLIMMLR